VRICLVYDCLYPYTVGGAERWYRNLALRLAADGHDVTYLTRRQWRSSESPELPGVRIVVVAPRMELYTGGRRRIGPPLVFGLGVLGHLAVHGTRYDAVHTASFPYFSLLAAGAMARLHGFRLVVDWHEVWTPAYWSEYLGALGPVGVWVQRLCVAVPQQAFCFSRLHAHRLETAGVNGPVRILRGQFEEHGAEARAAPPAERVVYAGRHIPEKRVSAIVPAVVEARKRLPSLEAAIFGDGPERPAVIHQIAAAGLGDVVVAPGFAPQQAVEDALASALCLVLPSRREGYGLVVVEAIARGTPAVVVADEDNAASELVEHGVNGFIAASATPADLAEAIVRVREAGAELRRSTADWYVAHRRELSLESSLDAVAAAYGDQPAAAR
jgi:glycosyltransferase involved in cell wall biosynthesis